MKNIFILCAILVSLFQESFSQECSLIYFPELDWKESVCSDKLLDTIKVNLHFGNADIVVHNLLGKSIIRKYYNNHKFEFEGQYIEALGPLAKYVEFADPLGEAVNFISIQKYYQPLPDGIWKYYNKEGEVIKEITYKVGIIVNTKIH